MDETWERAVETALNGQTDLASVRTLTLDGAVKCVHGRLPPPNLLEKFQTLQHLSIANIGVSSVEQFPCLPSLQKLILSDNRIAGGLEYLVEAGLSSLRDLDLSNNRIQYVEDLAPLAKLSLVSLDLYECPVTRIKGYRGRVFSLIKSLKYLDKIDAEDNERPESDDEDEGEDSDEDDPGCGEIDGEDNPYRLNGGHSSGRDGIVDVDEDEESDADEGETEIWSRKENGIHSQSNGFIVAAAGKVGEEEDGEDDEESMSVEEIDEENGEDEDTVEIHEIEVSDGEDRDEDDEDEVEEVDNEDRDLAGLSSMGRLPSIEGEIDGHDQGEEEEDEDVDGETGEEQGFVDEGNHEGEDNGEEEEEDYGAGYSVRPVGQAVDDAEGSDMEPEEDDDEEEVEDDEEEDDDDVDNLGEVQVMLPSSQHPKRKKEDDEVDYDDLNNGEDEDECSRSQKKHHR